MKYFIFIFLLSFFGCSGRLSFSNQNSTTDFKLLYNKYDSTHFFGVGLGKGATEQLAIKIGKAKALGELASTIKVTVMSRIEMISNSQESDLSYSFNETLKQQIISIGNATVRSPEYEILNLNKVKGSFEAEVLAKKNKKDHFLAAARDLELDGGDELFNMIINKGD